MSAPLYGLLLTGGHSRRMQRDKAALEYAGRTQLQRALTLLQPLVSQVFVSVRPDQQQDPLRATHAQIADRIANIGPLGGIHAALHAHPQAAWLVLAIDLPFLDAATLQQLISARDPQRYATAFRSQFDGKPEPLCAIWEPHSRATVDAWIAADNRCPRSFLINHDALLLNLHNPRALDNINTSAEYIEALAAVSGTAPAAVNGEPITVRVQYFAALRDQAGRSEETVHTQTRTPRALFEELRSLRGLQLRIEQLRVAINEDFAEWNQPLASGDTVVFLPPVAGG